MEKYNKGKKKYQTWRQNIPLMETCLFKLLLLFQRGQNSWLMSAETRWDQKTGLLLHVPISCLFWRFFYSVVSSCDCLPHSSYCHTSFSGIFFFVFLRVCCSVPGSKQSYADILSSQHSLFPRPCLYFGFKIWCCASGSCLIFLWDSWFKVMLKKCRWNLIHDTQC